MQPRQAVKAAAFVLACLGFWETSIRNSEGRLNLKDNFLTCETKKDIIIACNFVILVATYMRQFCEKNDVFVKVDYSRLSSRFTEYGFQFLR